VEVAKAARDAPAREKNYELLIVDGRARPPALPRALGYIKSPIAMYLPPELNAVVGALPRASAPGLPQGDQLGPDTLVLRMPGPKATWSGVVRIECPASWPSTR